MSDFECLQSYARENSQAAFAALVVRHVDLVYSAALRQVRSPELAEEVAQSVFLDLSRHAAKISAGQPLAAWLYVVTRRTAVDVIRRESRRQTRERTAAEIAAMKETPPHAWPHVERSLDEAMDTLNDTERSAIVLRFFENHSLREVGVALGISEDTAQKRVSRALDQLRTFFARRGVAVTATSLATELSAHAIQAAPVGLGATISLTAASALTPTAAIASATLTMTALQKAALVAGFVAALGGAVFEGNALLAQRADLATLSRRADALAEEERGVREQRATALRRLEEAQQRLAAQTAAVKSPSDVALETEMNAWLDRVDRLKQLRSQRPELAIPELTLLSDESWVQEARTLQLESEDQIRDTFAHLRNRAESAFNAKLRDALRAYLETHDGTLPESSRQLAAFIDVSVDPTALDRYKMVAHGKISEVRGGPIIEQHSPVDFSRDIAWDIGLNGGGSQPALSSYVRKAIQEFTRANNGAKPTLPEQLQPFLPGPVAPAKLQSYLNPRR